MDTQITFRLPEALNNRLTRAAKRLGLKRSHVARLALQWYLDETEHMPRTRPYDVVKDLIGSLDSGVSDIGSRHREYFLRRFRKSG